MDRICLLSSSDRPYDEALHSLCWRTKQSATKRTQATYYKLFLAVDSVNGSSTSNGCPISGESSASDLEESKPSLMAFRPLFEYSLKLLST